jgi:hypothetical protein
MEPPFSEALAEFLKVQPPDLSKNVSPETLENLYTQALTGEDLETLDLPRHLAPALGRGLPKRYSQMNHTKCHVKESFTPIPLLRLLRIEKPIFFLYGQQKFPHKAKIGILTWVIADGIGDYFTQQEAANELLETFPDLYLISIVHKDSPALPLHPKCPHYLLHYSGKLNHPIIHEAFSEELLTKLSQTDLILELSTPFPYMIGLVSSLKKHNPTLKHQRIGEHSLIESLDFEPSTGARCMGLHALEMGIFSKKATFVRSPILQLQHRPLLQLLFSSNTVEDYLRSHSFNLAYTRTFRGTYLYLHILCKGLSEEEKNIDLCFFKLELMLKVVNDRLTIPVLKEWKIGKVLIYLKNQVIPITISNTPKTLRLIHCPELTQHDVHILFSFTEHLIGCKGDQTLCEAICSGVPFFYDPPHFKKGILKDLLFLAESRLPQCPLKTFFKLLLKNPHVSHEKSDGEWVSEDYIQSENDRLSLEEDCDEKIGDSLAPLIKNPQFKEGFPQLREIIQREYSFEPLLKGMINRHLFHQRFPSLMRQEQKGLSQFVNGNTSAVDFLKEFIN